MIVMRSLPLVLLLVAAGALADEPPSVDEAVAAGRAEMDRSAAPNTTEETDAALPATPTEAALADEATRQTYLDAMQRYYDYRSDGYEFRSRVFEWQLLSTRVIFVIVVLLVLAGIYFAAVQFHVALATARSSLAMPDTQLEVSVKGIVLKSSVLGVIILSLSLAFFYLYLVYVYPIRETL